MATLVSAFGTQAEIVRSGAIALDWTNPTSGAKTNENTFSVFGTNIGQASPAYSDWLVVSAPSGLGAMNDSDTVNGVTVNVYRRDPNSAPAGVKADTSLIHFSTVAVTAPNGTGKSSTTTWPVSETLEAFGGVGDIWGHASLVGSQMKAAGASVWISARLIHDFIDFPNAEIDYIEISVDYNVVASGHPAIRRHGMANRSIWGSGKPGHNHFKTAGGILLPSQPGKVLVAA